VGSRSAAAGATRRHWPVARVGLVARVRRWRVGEVEVVVLQAVDEDGLVDAADHEGVRHIRARWPGGARYRISILDVDEVADDVGFSTAGLRAGLSGPGLVATILASSLFPVVLAAAGTTTSIVAATPASKAAENRVGAFSPARSLSASPGRCLELRRGGLP
jgi:hypothetical protein